ncbi:MAG: polysaccharide deacetylase [Actinomycetia bacterium]|nr:polysaccharide deacetylase [Actinomycetes bacterium]
MRSALRRLAVEVVGRRSLLPASRRVVLLYHDVSERSAAVHSPDYSTTPATFARHLDRFERTVRFTSLDEVVDPATPSADRPLAALTFDDGFRSVLEVAAPELRRRGIPFTVFVNGRAVRDGSLDYLAGVQGPRAGGTRPYLDADELVELSRSGAVIGSHTTGHRPLAGLDDAELAAEIDANKAYLESIVDVPVDHLALPYGKRRHYDERALARAFAAGHRWVHGTNPTTFTAADAQGFDHRPVPRIGFTEETDRELLFLLNRPLVRRLDL